MQQVLEEHNIGEYLKNIASKVNPDWLIPMQHQATTRTHEDIDMDCSISTSGGIGTISSCKKRSFPNDSYFQMPSSKVRRC